MSTKTEIVVRRASYREVFSAIFQRVSFSTATGDYIHNASRLQMPSRSEASGRASLRLAAFEEMILLLLVVHCGALVFLALCIGSIGCDRPALAIGRDHNVGRKNNLTAFL